MIGDAVMSLPVHLAGGSEAATVIFAVVMAGVAILALTASAGFGLREIPDEDDDEPGPREAAYRLNRGKSPEVDAAGEPGIAILSLGALFQAALLAKAGIVRLLVRRKPADDRRASIWLAPEDRGPGWPETRDGSSPILAAHPAGPGRMEPTFDLLLGPAPLAGPVARSQRTAPQSGADRTSPEAATPARSAKVVPPTAGPRPSRASAPSEAGSDYILPPIAMLAEPRRPVGTTVTEDALQQNARLLEGVLDDFGVRGEIINVRPGPVVTLYELEPAPGIKSSRVIGLADDIARSMSAVSARVAVVQGRNVIGIELPNQRRETVFLRELIGSEDFAEIEASAAHRAREDDRGRAGDRRPRPHAAPFGGRHDRLGQVGRHQHHDPVAALPATAGRVPADHGRPQDA